MARNMFISTHHHWLSRFAFLASLIVLLHLLFGACYELLTFDSNLKKFITSVQFYFSHSIPFLIGFTAMASLYLHRELTMKPFWISMVMSLCMAMQYFIPSFLPLHFWHNYTFLIQTLLNLCILSMFWGIKGMTGPDEHAFISTDDKKYLIWVGLGFLLLCLYMACMAWVSINHAEEACNLLSTCHYDMLSTVDFHAIAQSPMSQEGLAIGYLITNLLKMITLAYLLLLSIFVILSRTLGEKGFLLLFLILSQCVILISEFFWQKSFWLTLGKETLFLLTVLMMTSLLNELSKKPSGSYS